MTQKELTELYNKLGSSTLTNLGFLKLGSHYVYLCDTVIFAIIKGVNQMQFSGFYFAYSHTFLRNLENEYAVRLASNLGDYPFVLSPSKVERLYTSKNGIDSYTYENGNYFDEHGGPSLDYENWTDSEAESFVNTMTNQAMKFGIRFAQDLNPQISLKLLENSGEMNYQESIWAEDLRRHFESKTLANKT